MAQIITWTCDQIKKKKKKKRINWDDIRSHTASSYLETIPKGIKHPPTCLYWHEGAVCLLKMQITACTTRLWYALASLPSAQPQNAISYTLLYYSEDLHNVWWSHTYCLTWPPWEDTISRLCPTFALLCRRSALICPTGQTSFANNILKLRGLSRDLLFICVHQYHPAATVTPGTLNLGCLLVASITKTSALSFCCFMSFFSGFGAKSGPCLQIVVS